MSGTGGVRKIRFSGQRSSGGKSGGVRVCYAYFKEFDLIYLCAVFPKNEKANLSGQEKSHTERRLWNSNDICRNIFLKDGHHEQTPSERFVQRADGALDGRIAGDHVIGQITDGRRPANGPDD